MSGRVRRAYKQSEQPDKYWSSAHTKHPARDRPAFLLEGGRALLSLAVEA